MSKYAEFLTEWFSYTRRDGVAGESSDGTPKSMDSDVLVKIRRIVKGDAF